MEEGGMGGRVAKVEGEMLLGLRDIRDQISAIRRQEVR